MITEITAILLLLVAVVYSLGKQSRLGYSDYEQWNKEDLDACDIPSDSSHYDLDYEDEEYGCTSYLWNYELVNMEMVRSFPPIVVYRGFVSKKYVNDFLNDIKTVKERIRRSSDQFQAIEITLDNKKVGAGNLYNKLKNFIPSMNFEGSDPWQILIFKRGDHYPPRSDYIRSEPMPTESSSITKSGNRFATFRVALKNAKQGGGMVFPMSGNTYYLQPGDVMMWTNMDSARQEDTSALHGDCPVFKGEKIVANLRLREHGQYLLASTFPGGFFNYGMLFRPHLTKRRMTPIIESDFTEDYEDTVDLSEY